MKKIVLYGAGGLGREIAQVITQINGQSPQWILQGFFDDHLTKGSVTGSLKVLGGINDLKMIGFYYQNRRKRVNLPPDE